MIKIKNYYKVKIYCKYTGKYQGTCYKICRFKDKILKDIPIIFHNGSNYDYHLIIYKLAISFKMYGSFHCLGQTDQLYNSCFDCKKPLDYVVLKDNKVVFRCFE